MPAKPHLQLLVALLFICTAKASWAGEQFSSNTIYRINLLLIDTNSNEPLPTIFCFLRNPVNLEIINVCTSDFDGKGAFLFEQEPVNRQFSLEISGFFIEEKSVILEFKHDSTYTIKCSLKKEYLLATCLFHDSEVSVKVDSNLRLLSSKFSAYTHYRNSLIETKNKLRKETYEKELVAYKRAIEHIDSLNQYAQNPHPIPPHPEPPEVEIYEVFDVYYANFAPAVGYEQFINSLLHCQKMQAFKRRNKAFDIQLSFKNLNSYMIKISSLKIYGKRGKEFRKSDQVLAELQNKNLVDWNTMIYNGRHMRPFDLTIPYVIRFQHDARHE